MLINPFRRTVQKHLQAQVRPMDATKNWTQHHLSHWLKWMMPGLSVKRWLLMSALGVLFTVLGLAVWLNLTPVSRLMTLVGIFLQWLSTVIPRNISGPIAIALGLGLIFWGQNRTFGAITTALNPDGDEELIDMLHNHRRLNKGPKIVAIGGGTGLSTLLRGLKKYSSNITAVVTVADDGGSSGRLRREIGVLPPGDIRNCLAAFADEEKLLTELFQYRFKAGDGLVGHSFGNLFLTAMSEITGDLEQAILASSKVLAIQGQVFPATLSDMKLWARLADGRVIEGESNIPEAGGHIVEMGCTPANPPALPAAIKAIEEADFIIMGPGSLYTSVIPNLLVPEIREAIARSRAPRIYVCNIMTQPGETDGYTVADHIKAIDRACGKKLFDAVLVHQRSPSEEALRQYALERSHPVFLDREEVARLRRRVVIANIMEEDPDTGFVRHNHERLAALLVRWSSRAAEVQAKMNNI
nr:gluconeogenesis factor YvcK family protein [Picosynechococcus sp. NKBG15041c]